MSGYSKYVGLMPTSEIVTPFTSTVNLAPLSNVSDLDGTGNHGSTYLYRPFYKKFLATNDDCISLTLAEIPSREYNYVRVLACTYREGFDDGSESDFLIDFTATWNTPGTSMPEPGVISQESEILGIFGDLNQGLCEIPGTNLLGIYATLGAGAELSDTILIKAFGIRSIVIRGIYEVI
jgi:hypothetical protein